jgi:hypothetical protein
VLFVFLVVEVQIVVIERRIKERLYRSAFNASEGTGV